MSEIKECIGFLFIVTAIIFGGVMLFGFDDTVKDKIITGITIEVFITLIIIGAFLMGT